MKISAPETRATPWTILNSLILALVLVCSGCNKDAHDPLQPATLIRFTIVTFQEDPLPTQTYCCPARYTNTGFVTLDLQLGTWVWVEDGVQADQSGEIHQYEDVLAGRIDPSDETHEHVLRTSDGSAFYITKLSEKLYRLDADSPYWYQMKPQ